ncbi:MAG: hypothetical protein C7B47_02270, partial [Sulfobacillus thermosulfidooxidans]
ALKFLSPFYTQYRTLLFLIHMNRSFSAMRYRFSTRNDYDFLALFTHRLSNFGLQTSANVDENLIMVQKRM